MTRAVLLAAFCWLSVPDHPADADIVRSMEPLAATATVINACVLAVANAVDSINGSKLVRAHCRKGTAWRTEIETAKWSDSAVKGDHVRVIINF